MKTPSSIDRRLVGLLCALCILCGSTQAQDWKPVADGVEHAQARREFKGKPVNFNLLRLDLKKVRIDVHHAMDAAIGTEKTSSIATRHGAFAAINAGFFRLDSSPFFGDSAGAFMVDGNLFSESKDGRILLELVNEKKETKFRIDHFNVTVWLAFDETTRFQSKFSGINRERRDDEIVLYTSRFGSSTLSKTESTEVVLDECEAGSSKTPYWFSCKKIETREKAVNTPIPSNGAVISFGPENFRQKQLFLNDLKIYLNSSKKKEFLVRLESDPAKRYLQFNNEMDIIAGVPQLIKNSKIDITWEQEKASKSFVETRHPRTAVAKLKDGRFLMLTADGRSEESAGIDLYDLAAYMLELGAVDAMNLDGGGSTTMFLDGKVVNKPSDKAGERKVGDAILVTLRKKKR